MTIAHRLPDGITCEDWEQDVADPKGRRCKLIGPAGSCPIHGRCTELIKREARSAAGPSVEPLVLAPPAPPSAAPAPSPSPADRARARYAAALPAHVVDASIGPDAPPPPVAKEIAPDRLADLEALSPEIHLVSPDLGDVFLVRERTGAERTELTFGQAATLRLLVDSFPGARVVALYPRPDSPLLGAPIGDVRRVEIAVADAPKAEGWDS
jgi:hypothetical protein